ncbi:hypothetical protein U1Q18_028009 [Sarracenia purpurea var. burkii]
MLLTTYLLRWLLEKHGTLHGPNTTAALLKCRSLSDPTCYYQSEALTIFDAAEALTLSTTAKLELETFSISFCNGTLLSAKWMLGL